MSLGPRQWSVVILEGAKRLKDLHYLKASVLRASDRPPDRRLWVKETAVKPSLRVSNNCEALRCRRLRRSRSPERREGAARAEAISRATSHMVARLKLPQGGAIRDADETLRPSARNDVHMRITRSQIGYSFCFLRDARSYRRFFRRKRRLQNDMDWILDARR